MNNLLKDKNIFFLIIGILVLGALITAIVKASINASSKKYDDFAQCLASKKLTIYGTSWCSHCNAEKALFGKSFQYVPYVECSESPDVCLENKIEGYPTWITENREKYIGELTLGKLSQISGCELPS